MNNLDPQTQTPAAAATDSAMFWLLEAAHTLQARLDRAVETAGLSMAKYHVLTSLAEAGEPLMLSELSARQGCVRSNMTQLVDRLEADGLVRRVDDPTDRRSVRAALTTLGEEWQAAGARLFQEVQAEFVASVPEADRLALRRVLSALS